MILIGQYDSPFVRRVGIALTLYGLPFEHRPWSTFSDAEKIRAYNPLVRVPTLVLDDGAVLIDSHIILDYLDSLVPAGRERAVGPPFEPVAAPRERQWLAVEMELGAVERPHDAGGEHRAGPGAEDRIGPPQHRIEGRELRHRRHAPREVAP